MSDPASPAPLAPYDRRDLALRVFALLGLAFSAMLLIDYVHTPVFCSAASSGCDAVRRSPWARPFGVPLPIFGAGFFSVVLGLAAAGTRPARRALGVAGAVSALSGLTFLVLQAFVIHRFCKLCVVVDTSAVLAGVMAMLLARDESAPEAPRLRWPTVGVGATALLLPIVFGLMQRPPEAPPNQPVIEPMPELVARAQTPGKATIVEFVDYECPFCRRQQAALAPVLASYGDRVRLIRKNVPLSFHEHARDAARAACCAEEQGRGERMADALFRSEDLTVAGCERIAQELHLDLAAYRSCLASRRPDVVLERDHDDARGARVSGLPTLWIGREKFEGFTSPEVLRASIDRAITASSTPPPASRSGT
jgi:protein-disulfide isomerase